MCYEPRNEEFAKVCRERDALRKKTAEQEKEILSLKEELQQARSILTEKYEETLELLEAAKNAQGLLQIHLVKVQEERDALLCIVKNWGECEHCKHVNEKLPEEDCVPGEQSCYLCTMEKVPCCECSVGNRWEWRGVKT